MSKKIQFTLLRTCNHCLETILTLKTQFENIFYEIFFNIFQYKN
jgi:hypothetical protein